MTTALVLGGGGARGAYEAGVISWLRDEFEPGLGRRLPLDVLAGTSVGAIHACFLAGSMDRPAEQGPGLIRHWESMRVEHLLRASMGDIWRLIRESFGRTDPELMSLRTGGLVDPAALRALVGNHVGWREIRNNIHRGHLQALAVSATHVASGRTRVFIQRREGGAPKWSNDPQIEAVAARIGPNHALASAAIPLIFPPVRVRGALYADGAVRMSVPLSPALRLGARRVAVISPSPRKQPHAADDAGNEALYGTVPYLAGKVLAALLMDRTDQDLARLEQINALLDAGTRSYGPGFLGTLREALVHQREAPLHYVRTLMLRPSADMGMLAADYVHGGEFKRGDGLAHRVILKLAERESPRQADLASFLLFDRGYATRLIELGRADARRHAREFERFFDDAPHCEAEEVEWEQTERDRHHATRPAG